MDAAAAVTAPALATLDIASLSGFLSVTGFRVVQAHDDGRPFGFVLKSLLHGTLGASLCCGRLDLRILDERCAATSRSLQPWTDLAGVQGVFPPPAGFYLFRGRSLVGFHPPIELEPPDRLTLARTLVRCLKVLVAERELRRAGREALDGRAELDVCRFFETASCSKRPMRAPKAGDRRSRAGRRSRRRDGQPRREMERLQADLAGAFLVLGLSSDTPLRAVKKVRNRWLRANHPDLLTDQPERMAEATRLTVRVNAAYATIRAAKEAEQRSS